MSPYCWTRPLWPRRRPLSVVQWNVSRVNKRERKGAYLPPGGGFGPVPVLDHRDEILVIKDVPEQ